MRRSRRLLFFVTAAALCLSACARRRKPAGRTEETAPAPEQPDRNAVRFRAVYGAMSGRFRSEVRIPGQLLDEFVAELEDVIRQDQDGLLTFCSKQRLLSSDYAPADLVPVRTTDSYTVNRNDLSLRRAAAENLAALGAAARADGITLSVSSAYRSYQYQEKLYARNVAELGQEAADRESARPGSSQHQLGVVADFGSVTDDFARTAAGRWLDANAGQYGWSLSFPQGYEDVTGFRWECWQYRYVGLAACRLQKKWFNNVQHFMLEFIDAWKTA